MNLSSPDIEAYYEQNGEDYAEFCRGSFTWDYVEKPSLDECLSDIAWSEVKVLDIGSGSGRIIEYLLSRGVLPQNVTGIDISEQMIGIAKRNLPEVNFLKGDVADQYNSKASFDLITAVMLLHYFNSVHLKAAFTSCYHLLTKGGTLCLMAIHPLRQKSEGLARYFHREWGVTKMPWGVQAPFFAHTLGDIIQGLIDVGFRIDVFQEPEITLDAKTIDAQEFDSYARSGPKRLVIRASKQ